MNPTANKWIARALIVSMVNPALFVPTAMARDTDIYSGFLATATAAAIQPNILLILDTSDSMNLPEAWKPYPGAYDSHVEYLWNDLSVIVDAAPGSAGENTEADNASSTRISTAAAPSFFTTKYGYWYGATLADRQTLWQEALNSAKAVEGTDPGPRTQYRNYNDLSWIYWLPEGADPDTDARLRSPSWNKFRGYIQELGNGAGGSQLRGGPSFSDVNDYRSFNQCGASLTDLTPSTVFVPSSVGRNSGMYLGQQWSRWEPYLALTPVNVSGYPGSSVLADPGIGGAVQQPLGYVDTSSPSTGNPASNPVYRDSFPVVAPTNNPPSATLGANGLPIRAAGATAGAGWDDIKADAGGFVLRDIINGYSIDDTVTTTAGSRLELEQVMSWYSLPATSNVDSNAGTNLLDAKFLAWKGNRDGSPAFGGMTGVPAYYDSTASGCDSATGPSSTTCLDKQSGTSVLPFTLTKNATCNLTGTTNETDGSGNVRKRGGTCTIGTITPSGTDGNGATYPNFSDVPNPTVCPAPTTADQSIRDIDNANCTRGTTTINLGAATTCALTGDQTLNIGACSVSGTSTVNVATCSMPTTAVPVAACGWVGRQSATVGSCAWSGRSAYYTEGVGWRATGGSCQQGGSTSFCNGVVDNNVYATQAAAQAATGSCTNTVSPGTYNYGGSCQENGSTSSCQTSGGTNVPGIGTNVNNSCTNTLAAGTYTYGNAADCKENGSTSSCQVTGGTTRTIRGLTQVFGQTCSNKANAGTTRNQPGNYAYGGTCASPQNNNTCTAGTGSSIVVRGGSYATTTCTPTLPTGTFHRGGACTGTNVPCQIVNNYGGTTVNSGGNTWYSNVATCTPPSSGTQTYYSSCTGRTRIMPGIPPGGNYVQTNGTVAACNSTTSTVNIGGTNYTNYLTCTDKPDVNTNCSTRYSGTLCQTACGAATPTSVSYPGSSLGHNYYRTYNFAAKTNYLVHDCKADEPAANPGGDSYMRNIAGSLAPLGTAFNSSKSASIASNPAAYSTSSSQAVAANAARKVNMYSVNYLNWKYGPKGTIMVTEPDPTDITKTITVSKIGPIGRKTRLQVAKDVLADVTGAVNGVRMGLMSFNQMEKASFNSSGAHLDKAIDDLGDTSKPGDPLLANRTALIASINALSASSATPLTETLYEAYRYFRGDAPWYGGNASGTDFRTIESKNSTGAPIRYVTEGVDTSTKALAGGSYVSPITTCQRNMVIFVSDGAPENDWSANTQLKALPDVTTPTGTVSIKQLTVSEQFESAPGTPFAPTDTDHNVPLGSESVLLDELAYYMYEGDLRNDMPGEQNVTFNAVKFGVASPLLDNAALVGGSSNKKAYEATDAATLKNAILDAISHFEQWQPQGSVAASTFNSASSKSGDVYLTAFSPSSNSTWPGTLKKYRWGFGKSTCGDDLCGNPQVCMTGGPDPELGFTPKSDYVIPKTTTSCGMNVEYLYDEMGVAAGEKIPMRKIQDVAISYWIPETPPDGGSGEKGGAGQVLVRRGVVNTGIAPDARKLYTFISGVSTSDDLTAPQNAVVDTNLAITTTLLGGVTPAQKTELIGFIQGSDGVTLDAWRTWAHFDAVHSAPVVDERPTGSTVFYMTSEGVLHAVDTHTGAERWAFLVEEGLPQLAAIKANVLGDHLEVADGSPVLVDTADGKHLVVFGMRRGGRGYYALDVTDINTPKIAWKITSSGASSKHCVGWDQATCTGGKYDELGQAWSTPVVGTVRGHKDGAKFKPVLIFGGGYDANQDSATPTDDTMGRAIFVADAATGNLIKEFTPPTVAGKRFSVPSDVLIVDATGDSAGTIDRAYVGDMGGNLWRMDLDDRTASNLPSHWSIVRLASLSTTSRPNKLFNRPTMAPASYKGQKFDAIFVGGGDLQKPLSNGSNDAGAFFMVKDFTIGGVATQVSPVPTATSSADFVDMTMHENVADLTAGTGTKLWEKLRDAKGGYVINLEKGEKVSSTTMVVQGAAFFGTYFPKQAAAAGVCELGGYGKQYLMDALTGTTLTIPGLTSISGRVYAYVGGFGVGLGIISSGYGPGGTTPDVFGGAPGVPAAKLNLTGAKMYWYSVPEEQN